WGTRSRIYESTLKSPEGLSWLVIHFAGSAMNDGAIPGIFKSIATCFSTWNKNQLFFRKGL
ncbi:MAG: hypothetical protein ABIL68_13485, partial [bacterium]